MRRKMRATGSFEVVFVTWLASPGSGYVFLFTTSGMCVCITTVNYIPVSLSDLHVLPRRVKLWRSRKKLEIKVKA